ncbi:ABC transporter ATP-binding protein [Effusibacillus pohliae]|uniref:ABC transporter ATP-binding protein n=1 Tax=Effusibacillus pohliae TaxID=232270 RepID=UPI0003675C56|nr:ABC transporter ATP-binding protein [Effusibacillus pohliae]
MSVAIVIEDLHKRYKDNHAVRGVSFTVEKGEIFGIVGPNGAGKTTTIEIMEGLRKRDSGTVRILGLDPDRDAYELRQRIGVQFQSTSIQERMKVGEAIRLFASFYRQRGDVERIVETLGLKDRLHAQFKDLSGGWKQRVTLALATIHDPEIVFLDEPSTGLDPQARREMWDLIRQLRNQGKTIVVTTHYMEEAERLCDRVAMFNKGKLAALDTPKRLVAQLAAANYLTFESAAADPDVIRLLPGVERVERDNLTVRVYSSNLQHTSMHLFQTAEQQNWQLEAFRFEVGSLDDIFVHFMEEGRSA